MRVFAITNQKGGVGKTTTAVNLAASLAAEGRRVLLIDLDPQGNATTGAGITKQEALPTVYQMLIGAAKLGEVSIRTDFGFDIVPANRELAGAEVELIGLKEREYRLKNALLAGHANYDFILIDCPPALNMLTVNGLVAADSVLIPMQCEYYALEGLSDLVNTIKKVHANLNRELKIIGLLRVMYDPRNTLSTQVSAQLEQHFGDKVFKTLVPRNIRLAEAPSYGVPGVLFDKAAKGAQAYMTFSLEMIDRVNSWKESE